MLLPREKADEIHGKEKLERQRGLTGRSRKSMIDSILKEFYQINYNKLF